MGYPPQGAAQTDLSEVLADTALLVREQQHVTYLFPESTARKITLTAGGSDNTWGDWAEMYDDAPGNGGPVSFSTKITDDAHITVVLIEDLSIKDKRYEIQIAYGDSKTVISPHRFLSGQTKFLDAIQHIRVRAALIPSGETVYYRMRCETGSATCEISIRYHYAE